MMPIVESEPTTESDRDYLIATGVEWAETVLTSAVTANSRDRLLATLVVQLERLTELIATDRQSS